MSTKTRNIINWVLAGLIGLLFLGSAVAKLMGSEEAIQNAAKFGLDATSFKALGVVELISVILFIIPRTGVLGTLLLASYMGGAIATHLEHGESIVPQCVIQAILWIVAVVRFPELTTRILGKDNA
jgi:hypothetical protein